MNMRIIFRAIATARCKQSKLEAYHSKEMSKSPNKGKKKYADGYKWSDDEVEPTADGHERMQNEAIRQKHRLGSLKHWLCRFITAAFI